MTRFARGKPFSQLLVTLRVKKGVPKSVPVGREAAARFTCQYAHQAPAILSNTTSLCARSLPIARSSVCRCLSYLERRSFRLAGEQGKHLPKQTAGQLERDAREALRYGQVPA